MKFPLPYMLPALDGSSAERAAVLQEIRDRGILETFELTAFCFMVEALLDAAETTERETRDELRDAQHAHPDVEKIRKAVDDVFDDLLLRLPKHADVIREHYIQLLRSLT
jgi:hypothetical protein